MAVVNAAKKRMVDVFTANPVRAMLLTATHVTNIDTQAFISDVSANQVTGTTNYPAGGFTMANVVSTRRDATDDVILDFDDYVANNLTATFRYIAFYNDTTVATTSGIIAIVDYGVDQVFNNANLTIQVPANGLLSQAQAA